MRPSHRRPLHVRRAADRTKPQCRGPGGDWTARRRRPDCRPRRIHRPRAGRQHDDARARRIGLFGVAGRGRDRTPPKSRSGPTWTGCSPPTRASSTMRRSCRTCRSRKPPSWRISAPRCCIPSTIFPAVSRNIPVRILNSRRPEAQGTLITADPPAGRPAVRGARVQARHHGDRHHVDAHADGARLPAAACSRRSRRTRRRSTWSRHRRSASPSRSTTTGAAPEIVASLLEFAEVTVEEQMAILTVVGDRLATNSTLAARIIGAMTGFPLRMISQAASRKNVTIVLPEASLAPAMMHLHRELFAVARRSRKHGQGTSAMSARLLLIGHGRMGRLVESLAAGVGLRRSPARSTAGPLRHRRTGPTPTSRSISRSRPRFRDSGAAGDSAEHPW